MATSPITFRRRSGGVTQQLKFKLRELLFGARRSQQDAAPDVLAEAFLPPLSLRAFDAVAARAHRKVVKSDGEGGLVLFEIAEFEALANACDPNADAALLQTIVDDVQGQLRGRNDVLCRFGDRQFAIALSSATAGHAFKVASRLSQWFGQSVYDIGGEQTKVVASFGYTSFSKYDTIQNALERAQQAMHYARSVEPNSVQSWQVARLAT